MAVSSTIRALIDRALFPVFDRLDRAERRAAEAERRLELLQAAIGRVEARQLGAAAPTGRLSDHEFRAFSQWGEDGIIRFLLDRIEVGRKVFVEFGVEDYREANTRFLAEHDNWTGLVMDGSRENVERVRASAVCWRHNLRAVEAFVTRENINRLISDAGVGGDIGLLSIDIDGNDYWVWEAVDVVSPALVIVEYNHRFGSGPAVTIPYDENFRRGEKHPVFYFGASLAALCSLGARKGYAFVGCNGNGVNAFFVRRDKMPDGLRALTAAEGYVAGTFTERRDARGLFVAVSPEDERRELMRLPLVEVAASE